MKPEQLYQHLKELAERFDITVSEANFRNAGIRVRSGFCKVRGKKRFIMNKHAKIAEKIDTENIELILSGHLHGGQVVVPFLDVVRPNDVCFVSRYYRAGLYRVNGVNLFSNRGLGTSLVPLRFLSRPEIAILEFTE